MHIFTNYIFSFMAWDELKFEYCDKLDEENLDEGLDEEDLDEKMEIDESNLES